MAKKRCNPPVRVRKAAVKLSEGTKEQRREAGIILAKHRWKNHG